MIVLEIHRPGSGETQIFTSDKRTLTLGRHSSNDIRLEEEGVSRFHAEFEQHDNRYFIRDLDSRNGLYVNRLPVLEHLLLDGDEIRIGSTKIHFHVQDTRAPHDTNVTQVRFFPEREDGSSGPTSVESVVDMPGPGRLVVQLTEDLESEKAATEAGRKALLKRAIVGLEIGEIIAEKADVDLLLQEALVALARRMFFTRGVILVWSEETKTYRPRAIYQDTAGDPDRTPVEAVPVSMTIVNQCLEKHQGICCRDAMSDPRFSASESIFDLQMRSVICVPLRGYEQDLGVIQVDSPVGKKGLKESDLPAMMLAASLLASALLTRSVYDQRRKRERRGDEARVLAAASHCLHSVFVMNQGQIDLLRQSALAEDPQLMTDAIDQFAEGQNSLSQMIEGLYDYVRGRIQSYALVDINDLLAGLLDELSPTFEDKGIDFEFQRDDALPEGYYDPAALRLLIVNLLINAIEALENVERPMIHVITEKTDDSKLCIRIQDNGAGMSGDVKERMFTPFFTTKGRAHPGLGLAYARHIVVGHSGRIEFESEPGLGTTFIVRLPMRMEPPTIKPSSSEPSSTASWLLEE